MRWEMWNPKILYREDKIPDMSATTQWPLSPKAWKATCCPVAFSEWKEMVPLTLLLIQCLPTSVIPTLWCSHSWWAFFNKNILLCGHNVNLQLRDVQEGLTSGQAWRTDWLMQDGSVSSPHFKRQKPFRINFKVHFKLNRNSHFFVLCNKVFCVILESYFLQLSILGIICFTRCSHMRSFLELKEEM